MRGDSGLCPTTSPAIPKRSWTERDPDGRRFAAATAHGVAPYDREVEIRDQIVEIRGLFEGTWTVSASARTSGAHWAGSWEVEAGGEATITMAVDPR